MQTQQEYSDQVVEIFTEHFGIASRRQANKGTGHYVRTRLAAVQIEIEGLPKKSPYPDALLENARSCLDSLLKQCDRLLAEDDEYPRISQSKSGRFIKRRDQLAEEISSSLFDIYVKGRPTEKSFSQKTIKEIRDEKLAKDLWDTGYIDSQTSNVEIPIVEGIAEIEAPADRNDSPSSNAAPSSAMDDQMHEPLVSKIPEDSGNNPETAFSDKEKFSQDEFEHPGSTLGVRLLELARESERLDSEELSCSPAFELPPLVRGDAEIEGDETNFQHSYWSLFDRNVEFGNEYRDFIRTIPLLSAGEQATVSERIEAGVFAQEQLARKKNLPKVLERELRWVARDGQRARNRMVGANLRLVFQLASRQPYLGLDLMDLVQEGNIGLIRAIEKFDYRLGNKFSTYATWWIRQGIQRAAADQGRIIRLPVHVMDAVKKLRKVRSAHFNSFGTLPTFEYESEVLEVPVSKIHELGRYSAQTLSLNEKIGQSSICLQDFLVDEDDPSTFDLVTNSTLNEQIAWVLDSLSERESGVIQMRFGLGDGVPLSLEAVGVFYGVTRERIRQIENLTLEKLRSPSRSASLMDYLDEEPSSIKIQTFGAASSPRLSDDLIHPVSTTQGVKIPTVNRPKMQTPKYIPGPRTVDDYIQLLEAAVDSGNWEAIEELENVIWELSQEVPNS